MDNPVITLLSSLVSGLVGVLIGTWLNRYYEERKEKVKILKTLITYRWNPANPERVAALNCIPVIFHKDNVICDAFDKYKDAQQGVTDNITNAAVLAQKSNLLDDAYVKIVELVAINLKFNTSISWDKVKNPYLPKFYVTNNGQQIWY